MHDRSCYGRLSPAILMRSQQLMWAAYTQVNPESQTPILYPRFSARLSVNVNSIEVRRKVLSAFPALCDGPSLEPS